MRVRCIVAACVVAATAVATRVAAQPPVDWPLSGEVVDASGAPIAGAEVWLVPGGNEPVDAAATTTSDAEGRFLYAEPDGISATRWIVWAFAEGRSPDWQVVPSDGLAPPPLRLALEGPVGREIQLLAPTGEPLEGIDLRADNVQRPPDPRGTYAWIPPRLAARLSARTGAEGRCRIEGLPPRNFVQLTVDAPQFGGQTLRFSTDVDTIGGVVFRLAGTGSIRGRLLADDPATVAGLTLTVRSSPEKWSPESYDSAWATATADDEGRFTIAPVAAGSLRVTLQGLTNPALRPELPPSAVLGDGDTLEWEIPVRRGARVQGSVRALDNDQPIAGATLVLSSVRDNRIVDGEVLVADEMGRLDGYIAAGHVQGVFQRLPPPFLVPDNGGLVMGNVASGVDFDLGVVLVQRGAEIRGRVLDSEDRPLAGATVTAVWHTERFGLVSEHTARAESDSDGAFVLSSIPPGQKVTLRAVWGDAASDEQVELIADGEATATLRLGARPSVAVRGRIVDADGRGVARARVHFQCRWADGQQPVDVVLRPRPFTDAGGRFETPAALQSHLPYRIDVLAAGCLPHHGDWFVPGILEDSTLPVVALVRLRTVAGRVVDRQGNRLAGVTVFQTGNYPERTETTTGADGRFDLPGFPDSAATLFAEAEGFRFFGTRVAAGVERIEIVLTRLDEPGEPRSTLSPALEGDRRRLAAVAVAAPWVQSALVAGGLRRWAQQIQAKTDPRAALDRLRQDSRAFGQDRDSVRAIAIAALMRFDFEEAVAQIADLERPRSRAGAYLAAADGVAETGRKREFLRHAVESARGIQEPESRSHQLAAAAERLLDLGEREEAEALLREGEELVRGFSTPGRDGLYVGAFAEELAQSDLPAALRLAEGLQQEHSSYDRHHANIAQELGGLDPADAERVLGMIRDDAYRQRATTRVCHRMAPVDLDRARRLLGGITGRIDRAYALGMMAEAIAERDPAIAESLLRDAYALLRSPQVPPARDSTVLNDAGVAGALLAVAEAIHPRLVEEFLWQAVSLRQPAAAFEGSARGDVSSQAELALMLARYDRELAREVLTPLTRRLPEYLTQFGEMRPVILAAAAEIDPLWAAELVERLPAPATVAGDELQHAARLTVAEVLARCDDARWREWQHEYLQLWTSDREE